MKTKIYVVLFLIALGINSFSQEVDKNFVVAEFGTGTWCVYCPGAAMGAEDLITNGHKVAVIKYHNGDTYANSYASTRLTYYSISSFPTAVFDGTDLLAGGNANNSLYETYLGKYNTAMAVKSPYTISMEHTIEGSVCNVEIIVKEVANYSNPVNIHLVITESNIEEQWQNQDMLHYVARKMVPNSTGTTLDLSLNETDTIELSFDIDEEWAFENCEIIAFVQNNVNKAILNADKKYLEVFDYDLNAEVTSISLPINNGLCASTISPEVEIINKGNEYIRAIEFTCNINGGEDFVYEWEDGLDTRLTKIITIPEFEVGELLDENTINIEITKVNWVDDEFVDNNSISDTFLAAPEVSNPYLNLEILTDSYGTETTWILINENNDTLYSGGPYTNAVETYTIDIALDANGCYDLYFFDKAGDGMEVPGEIGHYILTDQEGNEIISGGVFDYVDFNSFSLNTNFNGTDIISFLIDTIPASIDETEHTITFELNGEIASFVPHFELSLAAELFYNDEEIVSGVSEITADYDNDMVLTVKAGNETDEQTWTLVIVDTSTTSIDQFTEAKLNVFPNPAKNELNIISNNNISNIQIVNTLGATIKAIELNNTSVNVIDISDMQQGVYYIIATTIHDQQIRKSIIKI